MRNELKMPSSISNMFKIRITDRYDLKSNNNKFDLGKLYGKEYLLFSCIPLE
jgi:hypothetical protein